MGPREIKAAVFVTRDGYVSGVLIDATPDSITMAIKSRDLARNGQELTFIRRSPALALTSLYEEEPAEVL